MDITLSVEHRLVSELTPFSQNARTHSDSQIAQIAASIREFGWTNPILIDGSNGIIAGHGRLAAARKLGMTDVPVIVLDHLTEAQKRALVIADNQLALTAGWDFDMLANEIAGLNHDGFDLGLLGFDNSELTKLLAEDLPGTSSSGSQANGNLADQFGAPPFSILDTRQGYWQERRDQWLVHTGNLSETKEGVLGQNTIMSEINEGSSNFDPVLAELMMRWFCPAGGKVLDPFGGEQTKGVVAGMLGLQYRAVEYRAEQVAVNEQACARFGSAVQYKCGDSEHIDKHITERGFNMCFTSPPYYDLEVYSKEDMSALGTYAEFMDKYEKIFARCYEMLADNSFLVIKICEIRNKKTGEYRNFVGDNIAMFNRLGFKYYNEIALINSFGTAPQRAAKAFGTRKLVKVHQNVLVFWKGDLRQIKPTLGDASDAVAFPE